MDDSRGSTIPAAVVVAQGEPDRAISRVSERSLRTNVTRRNGGNGELLVFPPFPPFLRVSRFVCRCTLIQPKRADPHVPRGFGFS